MKKLFFAFALLLILLFFPYANRTAFAQGNEPPIPAAPANGNVVLDTLDWLTPEQEAEINEINRKLDQEGIAQIAVVTLNDCGTDKKTFRNHLFNTWGIGHANDNDGLLILLCWYDGDKARRSVEQEVGYGLESTLTGTLTDQVAREQFITSFHVEHPGNGLVGMVREYDRILRQISPLTLVILGGLIGIIVIVLLLRRIHIMDKTHEPKQQKTQNTKEKRKIVIIMVTLLIFSWVVFLILTQHFFIAAIFGVLTLMIISIAYSPSPSSRIKKDNPDKDVSWASSFYSSDLVGTSFDSSGFSGSDGGGSFDGGGSGGSGSSTGF